VTSYRQPAEWAPHAATWVAWPAAEDLWQENLAPAQAAFTQMCVALADPDEHGAPKGDLLKVLVADAAAEKAAMEALRGTGAMFHRFPYGDIWLRDTAPIFVRETGRSGGPVAAACFRFNGWGGKYVLDHDDAVSAGVARMSGCTAVHHDLVLEGGSVEVDGEGTLLTTRQCLLNENRNKGMSADAIERAVMAALGGDKVLWLGDGLLNDHTDGHIDTVARFVRPGVVVCMTASGDDDPNAKVLEIMADDLQKMKDARGRSLEVIRIPSPGKVLSEGGDVMPASYVNFYVGNTTVVVPTYGVPPDGPAVEALQALFPERRVVGVDARAILTGGGAFHCITQQEPR
jgi:agmatine deiminase